MINSLVLGQSATTGLYFLSHNQNIDKRTSLVLNDNEPYKLNPQDNLSFSFDFFVRKDTVKFGYIFRIISNKNENFDFIINNTPNGMLVINNQDFYLKKNLVPEQWNHVSISFDRKQNAISLRFNDEVLDCPYDLSSTKALNVSFGKCDYKGFLVNDVSPFVLKNVAVGSNDKEIHFWALEKHAQGIVYDELKNEPAIVQNPHWLIDNRIHWKKRTELSAPVFSQVTFDSTRNKIYLLNSKELVSYSLTTELVENIMISGETPQNQFYNRFIYNPILDELEYYGFESDLISHFDMEKRNWIDYENNTEQATHAHHNRYFSNKDSMLYLFGGYGFYKYNSDFFRKNPQTNEKEYFDLSHTITPRYLAAMGGNAAGDKVYIFGGRGADMGRQELSPKNFSDLFEVDLQTVKVRQLFDLDKQENGANVYSNSLIMDDTSNSFYVLAYPNNKYSTYITLKRVNLATQEIETLADSIEFFFRDITSFCDLYYSPSLSQLIALTTYSDDQVTSVVSIYTLDFPPLKKEDVIQSSYAKISSNYLTLAIILIFGGVALFLLRKKFWKRETSVEDFAYDTLETSEPKSIQENGKEKAFYESHKRAIIFFGGFQVFNKDGKNITGDFTPTLKYMLVLIVLYTLKDNKGISSTKLQELLWFDKSEEAARNNRSVNLRKLRVLLQEVGIIDITNHNGYWIITLPDDVFLDYQEALRLINKIHTSETASKNDVLRLVEILSYGPMLPNIQLEWVDNFKTDFSNSAIDVLMQVVNNSNNSFSTNLDIRLKIADSILKIDPINEEAVAIKCNALYKMGKKGLAKTTFDNFAKEYKLLLGEPYKGSIQNFLE